MRKAYRKAGGVEEGLTWCVRTAGRVTPIYSRARYWRPCLEPDRFRNPENCDLSCFHVEEEIYMIGFQYYIE